MATRNDRVFLNFPFDDEYEPLYVALIAGLTTLGLTPRCVLEIPPHRVRLDRLRTLIAGCGASVHDLSRVEPSGSPPVPRFNMPFELGLTLGLHVKAHRWFVLEAVRHRATRSLSDLGGYDVGVHGAEPEGMLRVIADAFGSRRRVASHADLTTLWRTLRAIAVHVRHDHGGLFTPAAFADLVLAGQTAAKVHFRKKGWRLRLVLGAGASAQPHISDERPVGGGDEYEHEHGYHRRAPETAASTCTRDHEDANVLRGHNATRRPPGVR